MPGRIGFIRRATWWSKVTIAKNYSLVLRQYLYNKTAWENYQKNSKSLARQSESQALDAQAEATVDLAERYFTALAAEDELELVRAERRTTQKSLDRVNALYEKAAGNDY